VLWRLHDKPDIPLTDLRLLPLLNTRNEQLVCALELIKSREKAALELQSSLKPHRKILTQPS